jgi:hypothetical protein
MCLPGALGIDAEILNATRYVHLSAEGGVGGLRAQHLVRSCKEKDERELNSAC